MGPPKYGDCYVNRHPGETRLSATNRHCSTSNAEDLSRL